MNETDSASISTAACERPIRYWLAVLNSTVLWFYMKNTASILANGYFRYKPAYLAGFPVPTCTRDQEGIITRLAQYRQFLKSPIQNTEVRSRADMLGAFLEEVIDACVMELYFPEHMADKDLCVNCGCRGTGGVFSSTSE